MADVVTPDREETPPWTQGALIPLQITDLSHEGEGIGHYQDRVVFVPSTVPGDEVEIRLVQVKPRYAHGLVKQITQPSPHRIRPACIVADKCGGCQWQHVAYDLQLQIKHQLVQQSLERIGKLDLPAPEPILGAESSLRYRNKVTYPIDLGQEGQIRMGYYQLGTHQLINLNQCPVQDERLDVFLQQIKQDLQTAGWSVYNERNHTGSLRHLGLRIGRRTGEVLLTLVVHDPKLKGLPEWGQRWLDRYPNLVGVCLNINPKRTNAIFGPDTQVVAGRESLREEFAGFSLWIDSTSFFQIYTEQAERLFLWIVSQLDLKGDERVMDAYCGIGTLSLPMSQQVRHVIGIESHPAAVRQARQSAQSNQIQNADFVCGKVETTLPSLPPADIVLLDPPRRGCDRAVLDTLLLRQPQRIVYISCHAATLARDLQILTAGGHYKVRQWRAADFFPQTVHVETVVFLDRQAPLE